MFVTNKQRITIDPRIPEELAWWKKVKVELIAQGYMLYEDNMVAFYADKTDTLFFEVGSHSEGGGV